MHKIIGNKPWAPKIATRRGPIANPTDIEELYNPIDFPLFLSLDTMFAQVSIVIQFIPPIIPNKKLHTAKLIGVK